MEVIRDGQPIALTAQEFKTLKFMMQNAERVISRDELLNEVWGYQNYPSTRTVDNHILKLRQKLEKDPANPVHFRTVHGMGYKFVRVIGPEARPGGSGRALMLKLRMRTKFLLSMLLISAGLTCTSLLLVRHSVQKQVRREIFADLRNSVSTFQNFQRERELTLTHSAELLADLPNLRALMTTQHEATIQDASSGLWRLAGSDLFILADRTGRVVALHTASPGLTREMAQQSLAGTLSDESSGHWWFGGQHLYEVFLRPIYFGPAEENHLLGFLVIGYEIDDRLTSQVGRIAASQVAFYYGDAVVKTTLSPMQESELGRQRVLHSASEGIGTGGNSAGRRTLPDHFAGTGRRQKSFRAPERAQVLRSGDRLSRQP